MSGRFAKNIICLILLISLPALAQRQYQYALTVGMPTDYENFNPDTNFTSINSAIAAMNSYNSPPLGDGIYGCIKIYEGIYLEQINSHYPNSYDLPACCDLIGMASDPANVVIQHWSQYEHSSFPVQIIYAGIYALGDNMIYNLTISNQRPEGSSLGYVQNSIEFTSLGIIDNCNIVSRHTAVTARDSLTVNNSSISSLFTCTLQLYSCDFSITNTNLDAGQYSSNYEYPTAFNASNSSGIIDNVSITSSGTYSASSCTPSLNGIIHSGSITDHIQISNTNINLSLTSTKADSWSNIAVTGIKEKGATAYINNTSININVTEAANSNALDVAGVLTADNGIAHLDSCNISTARTAPDSSNGSEYFLANQSASPAFFLDDNTTYASFNISVPSDDRLLYCSGNLHTPELIKNNSTNQLFPSIQLALDSASLFDSITVQPGYYFGSISMPGKGLLLQGSDSNSDSIIATTIIDADGAYSAVKFNSTATPDTIKALTITNAQNGIIASAAHGTISSCNIKDNDYAGIYTDSHSSLTVCNSAISGSDTGIMLIDPAATNIIDNTIYGNSHAIITKDADSAIIRNNTIVDNHIGGISAFGSDPQINSCIIWNCSNDLSSCKAMYSCISDTTDAYGEGNITADPCFIDSLAHNYKLLSTSPCINSGDEALTVLPDETDSDGCHRIADGRIDIGSDEASFSVYNQRSGQFFVTIQEAVDLARTGDTITVYPGIYKHPVIIYNKCITLTSSDPYDPAVVASTILNIDDNSNAITLVLCSGSPSEISGFTIRNASYGIYCNRSDPLIFNCNITNSSASGIYCLNYSCPTITNCTISNSADCGIMLYRQKYTTIQNCIINANTTGLSSSSPNTANSDIRNNTITDNSGYGVLFSGSPLQLTNCIIWNNAIDCSGALTEYCCLATSDTEPGSGCFSTDPKFVPNTNFHIAADSPCIDTGLNFASDPDESIDIDLSSRVVNGTIDIGADEFYRPYYGGSGTIISPFLIYDRAGMLYLASHPEDYDQNFRLMADISFANLNFDQAVIAPNSSTNTAFVGTPFTGSFDGNGCKISDLKIHNDTTASSYLGLFGNIAHQAILENMTLTNIDVTGGSYFTGSLCGCNDYGTITGTLVTNSSVTGLVYTGGITGINRGTISGSGSYQLNVTGNKTYTGGVTGANYSSNRTYTAYVTECFAIDSSVTSYVGAGGLVGYNSNGAIINRSFASGLSIQCGRDLAGGLAAMNACSQIIDSYATATSVRSIYNAGGIAALSYSGIIKNTLVSCSVDAQRADVFANSYFTTATGCLYNSSIPGLSSLNSLNITPKTQNQLSQLETYQQASWSISTDTSTTTWQLPNTQFPHLSWEL